MVLHNDIWGDTSVIIIEEMDNQFLVVKELNMLALYSKLDRKQSKTLQEALITFYKILFNSKDKVKSTILSHLLQTSHSMTTAMDIFA